MAQTTIEKHYNKLRTAALRPVGLTIGVEEGLSSRLRTEARRLAALDWPRLRSRYAAGSLLMPEGPNDNFYWDVSNRVSKDGFDASKKKGDPRHVLEPDYVTLAWQSLLPELERESARAKEAFEAYRKAVEQGVAVQPPEEETDGS